MILSKYHHVACNIYLSAGQPVYRAVLEQLLQQAQQESRALQQSVTIVHAFCDTQYDRTSFHLAGSPWAIATLATSITSNAMQVLHPLKLMKQETHGDDSLEHPTVGLVDHISILPLDDGNQEDNASKISYRDWRDYYNECSQTTTTTQNLPDSFSSIQMPTTTLPSGWVAWTIGWSLVQQQQLPVDILYYGHAHPANMPLAQVRREHTNFFGNVKNNNNDASTKPNDKFGKCTIGAPPHFVENYNIRLTTNCNKQMARNLCKAVREKDGGLPFVEALTLPYGSQNVFEVACNLLNPKVTCSQDIDQRVAKFFSKQQVSIDDHLDVAYRVGTTEPQCLQAIQDCQSFTNKQLEQHDQAVREQFRACFE